MEDLRKKLTLSLGDNTEVSKAQSSLAGQASLMKSTWSTQHGGKVYCFQILDCSHPPEIEMLKRKLADAAAICHQSELNCLLLLNPRVYPGFDAVRCCAVTRNIENFLFTKEVHMDCYVTSVFKAMDSHPNDKRMKTAPGRLVVSNAFRKTSPWLQTDVAQSGVIHDVPLIPIGQMTCFSEVGHGDPNKDLGAGKKWNRRAFRAASTYSPHQWQAWSAVHRMRCWL